MTTIGVVRRQRVTLQVSYELSVTQGGPKSLKYSLFIAKWSPYDAPPKLPRDNPKPLSSLLTYILPETRGQFCQPSAAIWLCYIVL